uniref:Uncharacterized protein n=1 Tax=Tanacetum cinerariifolium TaxID=118510 RepID=A0A6L2KUM3_TANCI|nr:hypothetical protein [Tanacetum cinerariifolium]
MDDHEEIAKIFKIEDNLFDFETALCKAFNEFNYLLKIDTGLFTFNIQGIRTYEEYELNNNMTGELEEPWSDNGVPYQLCDHICEPYRFKNGKTKWPTCSLDIDGFCKGIELNGMVNANENASFARWESRGQGPYANAKTQKDYDPYLDINRIFGRDIGSNNAGNIQDNMKEYHNPLICKIRRFEMMKYSFDDDDEYVAIKEREHPRTNIDACQAYRELFCIMDEGWFMTKAKEE